MGWVGGRIKEVEKDFSGPLVLEALMKTSEIKKQLRPTSKKAPKGSSYLNSGSTLLNLAMTGNPHRGYLKGHWYTFTGDSRSGKTWLALTALAEASINPAFDDYRLIYDDVEHGALMDKVKFFGPKMAARVEPPSRDKAGNARCSYLLEDVYFNIHNALEEDKPFIYVIDSMDSLTSGQEVDKFAERKKAREADKETTGTMTDGKAKINSSDMRLLITPLFKKQSIVLAIHQTRDRIGFGAQYSPKTRSGGNAPGFYACMELWTKVVQKLSKHIKGKDRQIGTLIEVETRKDRMGGKDRKVTIPIYWSVGIDDVGACVDYLVEEKHWKKAESGGKINAKELGYIHTKEGIIRLIQADHKQRDVQEIVADVWDEIEAACVVDRMNKYAEKTE